MTLSLLEVRFGLCMYVFKLCGFWQLFLWCASIILYTINSIPDVFYLMHYTSLSAYLQPHPDVVLTVTESIKSHIQLFMGMCFSKRSVSFQSVNQDKYQRTIKQHCLFWSSIYTELKKTDHFEVVSYFFKYSIHFRLMEHFY